MIRLLLSVEDDSVGAVLAHLQKMPHSGEAIIGIDLAPDSEVPSVGRRPVSEDEDDDDGGASAGRLNGVTYQLVYRGRRVDQHLQDLQLTGHSAAVAAYIARNPNCTARELKDALGIKPKAVESTIYQLRVRGVIESVPVRS